MAATRDSYCAWRVWQCRRQQAELQGIQLRQVEGKAGWRQNKQAQNGILTCFCARRRRTAAWIVMAAALRRASSAARAACFLPSSVSLQGAGEKGKGVGGWGGGHQELLGGLRQALGEV